MRGRITKQTKQIAKDLLGIENLSAKELRLMPYLQYIMMNEQTLKYGKISIEEEDILKKWEGKGWISIDKGYKLSISKIFYDALCQLMWESYINVKEAKNHVCTN